jgi:hypothetical protein
LRSFYPNTYSITQDTSLCLFCRCARCTSWSLGGGITRVEEDGAVIEENDAFEARLEKALGVSKAVGICLVPRHYLGVLGVA